MNSKTAPNVWRANLVSTPVPNGRNGETNEDTGPRQTIVVSGANKMQGVVWRNAAVETIIIHAKHSTLDRRVGNCAHKVAHHCFQPADLDKTYVTRKESVFAAVRQHNKITALMADTITRLSAQLHYYAYQLVSSTFV